jgi:methionyl aminopeptidase
MNDEELKQLKKAGEIAKKVKEFARQHVRPEIPLLELAEKIENEIISLGGKPAFPVNLSINEIAAHSTPAHDDKTKAHGLIKIDIGVSIDGYVADTAFSIDLDKNEDNEKLIHAVNESLKTAVLTAKYGTSLGDIGTSIEKTLKSLNFQPVRNLSGHSIETGNLHAGITIPNYNNSQTTPLRTGVFAIEPFATNGFGSVRDGKPSGIYELKKQGNVRDSSTRKILNYIIETYNGLPFCSRWLVKEFGTRAILSLNQIEQAGLIHHFPQLIEKNKGKVAQAEHTIIVFEDKTIVTT